MAEIGLDAMRVVASVAEAGSIAGAAGRLGVSPQAVSARVRALEARLGSVLFLRSAGGVRPTETGTLVAEWAAEVLDAAATFDERVASLAGRPAEPVRVAASLTVAEHLVPSWMVAYPGTVDLAVANSSEVAAAVRTGAADLGFVETTDLPSDLASTVVARDELVLVVAPGHPLAARGAVSTAELADLSLVTREPGSGTRTSYERLVREHGAETVADPARVVATTAGVRAAVIAGAGPAVLSTLAVRDDLALGRLVPVRIVDGRLVRPLSALWASGVEPSGAVATFLDVARRTIRSD